MYKVFLSIKERLDHIGFIRQDVAALQSETGRTALMANLKVSQQKLQVFQQMDNRRYQKENEYIDGLQLSESPFMTDP